MILKLIDKDKTTIRELDMSPTDQIAAPLGSSIINTDHYNTIVEQLDPTGSGEDTFETKEIALLGALNITSKWDDLTLEQLKVVWKKRVKRQAEDAFGELYSLFEAFDGLVALVGTADPIDRTKSKWTNLRSDVIAYRQALIVARTAIDAATTKETVMAIKFIKP